MDSRSKFKQSRKRQKRSPSPPPTCVIPTQVRALNYSSPLKAQNFYKWANQKWLRKTPMPTFENDYGVSEEVERCIYNKSLKIILDIQKGSSQDPEHVFLRTLADSCLHSRSQHESVSFLKRMCHTLECVQTPEDIFEAFANLSMIGFASLFSMQYTVKEGKLCLCIDGNVSSLPTSYYRDPDKTSKYKNLLQKAGKHFDTEHLEKVFPMEHTFSSKLDEVWSEELHKTTGQQFAKKFSGLPWDKWFEVHGLQSWKTMTFYYRSPRWFRFVKKMLKEVSLDLWKLYLARAYIIPSLRYLPPPYDEMDFAFFGKLAQGQVQKMPQQELLVNIVHDYCANLFSRLYWEKEGDKDLEESVHKFVDTLFESTYKHLEEIEWMIPNTREKAIEKVKAIRREVVRPSQWTPFTPVALDPKNLLWNIFELGRELMRSMFSRVGQTLRYWDEGIYRVNAYYYNENNEIMIPFGTVYSPFYSTKYSPAWNYGALGSIIGHEICHAFDEDGHLYNEKGKKKKWWTRHDILQYNHKSKALVKLFDKQKVDGVKVNGKKTLSENLADLGGLAIALEALQRHLEGQEEEEKVEAYREFFLAYAVSWRTKYRKERLQRAIETDSHAPAFLRVNMTVCQFDEWYEAFGIKEGDVMYVEPKERVRIF